MIQPKIVLKLEFSLFFLLAIISIQTTTFAKVVNPSTQTSQYINLKELEKKGKKIILSTKQIKLKPFPRAFNPSIIPYQHYYMLAFRHTPSETNHAYSHMGIVLLNNKLKLSTYPQLLPNPGKNRLTDGQTEDPRLFMHNNKIHILYNDNPYVFQPHAHQRRDMYMAELVNNHGYFKLDEPTLVFHEKKYDTVFWQKNWVPFERNNNLFFSYSIAPHEVLISDPILGSSSPFAETKIKDNWRWGCIRGGTPALEVDGNYLSFFHSSEIVATTASDGKPIRHYFLGAYIFSRDPPFKITKMSRYPIVGKNFYTKCDYEKRVIFPGGFIVKGNKILLAYGKDDREIWIATIDKRKLMESLQPVN